MVDVLSPRSSGGSVDCPIKIEGEQIVQRPLGTFLGFAPADALACVLNDLAMRWNGLRRVDTPTMNLRRGGSQAEAGEFRTDLRTGTVPCGIGSGLTSHLSTKLADFSGLLLNFFFKYIHEFLDGGSALFESARLFCAQLDLIDLFDALCSQLYRYADEQSM